MQCPVCKDPQLVISERQGIEIDYCPACRGVWLDRGELDKLIEKATSAAPPPQQAAPAYRADPRAPYPDPRYGSHKRPKSWLSEIFD
jgi:Zn-finger nucleic acid-binding protein